MRFKGFFIGLLVLLYSSIATSGQAYINDTANILSADHKSTMMHFSAQVQEQSGIELAVVTLASLEDQSIEEKAVALFEEWGIGSKADNLGLLFLIALEDRQVRIEVGYGLEAILPDAKVGQLLDTHVLPLLKRGELSEAIFSGYRALLNVLSTEYAFELSKPESTYYSQVSQSQAVLALPLLLLIACLLPFRWGRRLLYYALLFSLATSSRRGYSGYGSFGGSGFGGFGGGLSGGGGASRNW